MKTAFVFAGGGSLGANQVGMLKALVDAGVVADFVVGSSVGAINAARFAQQPDRHGVDALARIWSGVKRSQIFDLSPLASLLRLLRLPFGHDALLDPGGLETLLRTHLPLERLEDAALPCTVVATDLQSGEVVGLSRGPAVEAILASAAIPGIFPPVSIGGRRLVDGGVAANTPVAIAHELGAERIIVLPTVNACARPAQARGPLGVTLQAVQHLVNAQLVRDVARLRGELCLAVVPPTCSISVSVYDFSRCREMMDSAEASTRAWLAAGGVDRCEIPQGLVVPPGVRIAA